MSASLSRNPDREYRPNDELLRAILGKVPDDGGRSPQKALAPPPGVWHGPQDPPGAELAPYSGGSGPPAREPDILSVSFRDRVSGDIVPDAVLTGEYCLEPARNHGRPVYKKRPARAPSGGRGAKPAEVFIYFWDPIDDDDPDEECSWWFGGSVGGDGIYARNDMRHPFPPERGWLVVAGVPEGLEIVVTVGPAPSPPEEEARPCRRSPPPRAAGDPGDSAAAGGGAAKVWVPPKPWVRVNNGSAAYYYNEMTGDCKWQPPIGSVLMPPEAPREALEDVRGRPAKSATARRGSRTKEGSRQHGEHTGPSGPEARSRRGAGDARPRAGGTRKRSHHRRGRSRSGGARGGAAG
mmetsp:Transcript_64865/g.182553  ORF Transcript_64865/g.182553 Transcript_64865/m.182553 type:complete len:351 (+) Transcript_64865:120-1172(+)